MHPDDPRRKNEQKSWPAGLVYPCQGCHHCICGHMCDDNNNNNNSNNNNNNDNNNNDKTTLLKLSYVSIKNLHQPNFANKQPSIYNQPKLRYNKEEPNN